MRGGSSRISAAPRPAGVRAAGLGRRTADAGPHRERTYVASGHGAWGITLGPASARLVADLALGRPVDIPPALDVRRFSVVVVDASVVILPLPVVPVLVVRWRSCRSWTASAPWTSAGFAQADDLTVLAGAVDVELAALALDEREGLPSRTLPDVFRYSPLREPVRMSA